MTILFAPLIPSWYSSDVNANPLIGAGLRFVAGLFTRSAARRVISSVGRREITKIGTSARVKGVSDDIFREGVSKGLSIANSASDTIDLASLLLDEKWDESSLKGSTVIINNHNNERMNTGEIVVNLQDKITSNVDVHATIEPIIIPPLSRLILDIDMGNPTSSGIKNLAGYYGSNQKYEFEKSGNIIIPKYGDNTKDIDQLLNDFEKNGNQSYRLI